MSKPKFQETDSEFFCVVCEEWHDNDDRTRTEFFDHPICPSCSAELEEQARRDAEAQAREDERTWEREVCSGLTGRRGY